MTLERVEVAKAGRPEDGRAEPEVGGIEDRFVIARVVTRVGARKEALDQLDEGLDPEAAGEVVIEIRDRLAMEDMIVRQVAIGGHGAPSGNLQVDPAAGFGGGVLGRVGIARSKGRRESPRCAGRCVRFADMRQLHRRMGDVGGMFRV
jgi:hypothetical protein